MPEDDVKFHSLRERDPPEDDLFTRGPVAVGDRAASVRIARRGDGDLSSVWLEQRTRYQVVPNGAVSGAPRLDVHELHMKPPNERHRGWTVHPDLAAATATGSKCVALVYQAKVTDIHWLVVSAPVGPATTA